MGEVALRGFLGGSDVAAALGLSPWKTPVALYHEKLAALAGEATQDSDSLAKRRGKRWEAVALEMLLDSLSEREIHANVVETNIRYSMLDTPWMSAEVDAVLRVGGADWNVEIKTVSPFAGRDWGDPESDEIPTHYAAQVQWGLMVTGRQTCVVGALFGADVMKPYLVERDEEVIAWLRQGAIDFWNNHVLAGVPPQPKTLADVLALHPRGTGTILHADERLTSLALTYRQAHAELKAREAEIDRLEFEIANAMRDATVLTLDEKAKPVFVFKPEEGPYLDQAKLKAEFPEAHKACMTKWQKRVLRYKPFDAKNL